MNKQEQFEKLAAAARQETAPEPNVVADVMRRIVDEKPQRPTWLRAASQVWRRVAVGGLAAALVLSLGYFWLSQSSSRSAYAAINRAIAANQEPKDRTYRLTIEKQSRWQFRYRHEATLSVRGNDRFVLERPTLIGGPIRFGNNGRQLWFIPRLGPVVLRNDSSELPNWLADREVELPYLTTQSVLQLMADQYKIESLPAESLPYSPDTQWQRVRGTRHEPSAKRPDSIELWAHPESGIVGKMILRWEQATSVFSLRSMTFELTEERPLPDSRYEHTSYHDAKRSTRDVTPTK